LYFCASLFFYFVHRDDTDKNQWFFSTGWTTYYIEALHDKWVFCNQDTLEHFAYLIIVLIHTHVTCGRKQRLKIL
jgi:hypothetical protein